MKRPRLLSGLRAFRRNEQGVVAVLFGVMALVFVVLAAVAIDVGNAYRIRSALQEALDSAMLSAGADPDESDTHMRQEVERFFNSNLAGALSAGTVGNVNLTVFPVTQTNVMHATLTATSQTFFGGDFGNNIKLLETFTYALNSTVQRAPPTEVALVLSEGGAQHLYFDPFQDGSRLEVQKRVASDFVKYILRFPDNQVAVVPYSSLVNIDVSGGRGAVPSWVEIQNTPKPTGTGRPAGWTGCVGFRPVDPGPGYPAANDESGKPYFYRTTIDQVTRYKYPGYLMKPDDFNELVGTTPPWVTWVERNGLSGVPYCVTPVIQLYDRSRLQSILARINAMFTPTANSNKFQGYDNIDLGLLWGWHMLDSEMPFRARTKQEVQRIGGKKVIILVRLGNPLMADHFLSQFDGQLRWWYNERERQDAYRLTKELCTNIKNEGIIIYVVKTPWYNAGNRPLYDGCASDPKTDLIFDQPDRTDPFDPGRVGSIMDRFREIGRQLTEPRLIPCPAEFCTP